MRIIKKINNNVAVGRDGQGRELIVFGKGVGFPATPYELTDLAKIDRTYYNVDSYYYSLLQEIPREIFLMVSKLTDVIRSEVKESMNPNLEFILADHVYFAVERSKKQMEIGLSYSYELEYQYPDLNRLAKWFVTSISQETGVDLGLAEVSSITMHFVNALEGRHRRSGDEDESTRLKRITESVTATIERFFGIQVDTDSYYYFRFKNHLKYLVIRKTRGGNLPQDHMEMYDQVSTQYPEAASCTFRIDDFLTAEFGQRCSEEELMYLIIHVALLYQKHSNIKQTP